MHVKLQKPSAKLHVKIQKPSANMHVKMQRPFAKAKIVKKLILKINKLYLNDPNI